MPFKNATYFQCQRPECKQFSSRPSACNPKYYRCPYCGGELAITKSPATRGTPNVRMAISVTYAARVADRAQKVQ